MIYVSEDIWSFDLEAGLKEISEQRREQALKFRHEQGQRLCVLAYQLLKQGLKEEYGISELLAATGAFLSYGKTDLLVQYWNNANLRNPKIERVLYAMRNIDSGISPGNADVTIHGGWMYNRAAKKSVYVSGKGFNKPLFGTGALYDAFGYEIEE